jgi:rhodanese-related sulfurtransferase
VKSIVRRGARLFVPILGLALAGCATSGGSDTTASTSGASAATPTPTPGYVRDLSPADFHDYLRQRPETFVVDVRQTREWDDGFGHLDNAMQIPLEDLETRLSDLPTDKSRPIAVYDELDVRSATAGRRIANLGYRDVVTMQGGLPAYRHAGF